MEKGNVIPAWLSLGSASSVYDSAIVRAEKQTKLPRSGALSRL